MDYVAVLYRRKQQTDGMILYFETLAYLPIIPVYDHNEYQRIT